MVAVAAAVAVSFVVDAREEGRTAQGLSSDGPLSPLEGEWAGEGTLTRCVGFDDEGCPQTLAITLTIDCEGGACAVTPIGPAYGSPPLRLEEDRYRAAGPVPPEVAPTCGGSPTRSALWRLELVVREGQLGASYSESTIQGFDCGATGVAWEVLLDRT